MLGRSKMTPAPMLPRLSKTVAPNKSWGLKPVCKVKSIDSSSVWNGNAVILVSGLEKCKLSRRQCLKGKYSLQSSKRRIRQVAYDNYYGRIVGHLHVELVADKS